MNRSEPVSFRLTKKAQEAIATKQRKIGGGASKAVALNAILEDFEEAQRQEEKEDARHMESTGKFLINLARSMRLPKSAGVLTL